MWGRLDQTDLIINKKQYSDINKWWEALKNEKSLQISKLATEVLEEYKITEGRLQKAQRLLTPWVIRHTKQKRLLDTDKLRREIWIGQQTQPKGEVLAPNGIPVSVAGLAPFLLASRAATFSGSGRAIYVEGLCSTFETFKHTRRNREKAMDSDDTATLEIKTTEQNRLDWYLENIEKILPDNKYKSSMNHPKVKATVQRTFDLWLKGEKVLIFCFYKETGKTLRNLISQRITQYIEEVGSKKLNCKSRAVRKNLELVANRLDKNEIFAKALAIEVSKMLVNYKNLTDYKEDIQDIVRFFLRSDASLVRYVPLKKVFEMKTGNYKKIVKEIFAKKDNSGLEFNKVLENFFAYIDRKLADSSAEESGNILKAMKQAQLPTRARTEQIFGEEPEGILPNVKKAAGDLNGSQKHNVMVTFNMPFLPDILIASSVMSEGMDLHLNCRHIIHHDLCWNPSNLEQRTGRIDRIGAKAEISKESIQVYYPYIAATQDEKMFKVVMDREQWFKVIMGEKVKMDQATIEREAARIPFPEEAAEALQFKLNVT